MTEPTATAEILLPTIFDRPLSYRVPDGMAPEGERGLPPGTLVAAPLGPRSLLGVVWDGSGARVDPARLRDIETAYTDLPAMDAPMRRFVDWIADYTLNPRGHVLRAALRGVGEEAADRPVFVIRATGAEPRRATAARTRVLAALSDGARPKAELAQVANVSPGVIDGLLQDGALERVALEPDAVRRPEPDFHLPHLGEGQEWAAEVLRGMVREAAFEVALLDGVTGSGKTEVYLEAVAEVLRKGRQALILVPEIALTDPFLDRFAARFGVRPAAWHAGIQSKVRAKIFNRVAAGEEAVVVGARSALFLPFASLGLVVVDEEHDAAYKQEELLVYNARDMAVVRGRLTGAPVVLASATPSIESRVNADRGRYRYLRLAERYGERRLPTIHALDMRVTPPPRGRFIAPPLEGAVRSAIERGEQALLFLNRRGYAPLTLCRACGHRFGCPNCSSWLVEHRFENRLRCHHCGHAEPLPTVCPHCRTEGKLAPVGPGVERLREEAQALFPEARLSVLSSDLAGVDRLREEVDSIARGAVDLVIGTQIVTKGHNFPKLTLVGVVDADLGFSSSDPRAAERTFQVLEQVTGRAGRGERSGTAILQTFDPDHPVIRAIVSGDREAFYSAEIAMREQAQLPPFGRLAGIVVSGPDRNATELFARALVRAAPPTREVRVLGPAPAPLALVRGRHRFRLLAQSPRGFDLSAWVRAWLAAAPSARGTMRVLVDIDPQSFM